MSPITDIEGLRVLAKERLPRMFYDYVDTGSWTQSTYHANEAAFGALRFHQRVGIDISERTSSVHLLGRQVTMPVAIAPVGLTGRLHADGEILMAKAAEQFGIPFALSTMSICSIEDVARQTSAPFWFQLYVMRDKDFMHRLISRARVAGCSALVVTLDLPLLGQRHRDIHNGLAAPPRRNLRSLWQVLQKPSWCANLLSTPRRSFGNIIGHAQGVDDLHALSSWVEQQFDPTLSWKDIEEIRQRWGGKLILKGITHPQDARMAAKVGADAIVVSNHGGRQLDGAVASLCALPAVVDAVGHEVEVHMDGGVRSGQDVLKAWALGARGVYIGRAAAYGLAAMGQPGVERALNLIHQALDLSLGLCGHTNLMTVDRDILVMPDAWFF
jgi:L-lactate dehydrogenase (cytochrome)